MLTVWSGPAVPADALDLTGGEEEAAVLAVAAGAADTATAWAPAPVPQVPVVAQGARLAGVAGVAGRAAALLRPAHQRAARQLRHRNVQHDLAEEGLRRGGRDRSPNQDGLRGETNLLQFLDLIDNLVNAMITIRDKFKQIYLESMPQNNKKFVNEWFSQQP